jgi:DnaJ like chaperone protein
MAWWGKLIGGTLGFFLGGPLGAVLGASMGHQYDGGPRSSGGGGFAFQERTQLAFFTATFSVMGHLAKADGHVSPSEISMAKSLMRQMRLGDDQQKAAIELFNQGKQAGFPFEDAVRQFRQECRRRTTLLQMFLEIQIQAAMADGRVDTAEKDVLLRAGELLGFNPAHVEQLLKMTAGGYSSSSRTNVLDLKQCYTTLGISQDASDAEVKRAYRRLMSQHHPDKLVAKGLPDEMIKLATEKTVLIRAAYDQVCESRGK